jgi:hypothetical protein
MKKNHKSKNPPQTLHCSGCGVKRENAGGDSVKILCWKCVILSQRPNAKII